MNVNPTKRSLTSKKINQIYQYISTCHSLENIHFKNNYDELQRQISNASGKTRSCIKDPIDELFSSYFILLSNNFDFCYKYKLKMKELGSRNSSQRLVQKQRRLGYNVISEFQNYRKQTAGYKISLHKITHPHCN